MKYYVRAKHTSALYLEDKAVQLCSQRRTEFIVDEKDIIYVDESDCYLEIVVHEQSKEEARISVYDVFHRRRRFTDVPIEMIVKESEVRICQQKLERNIY